MSDDNPNENAETEPREEDHHFEEKSDINPNVISIIVRTAAMSVQGVHEVGEHNIGQNLIGRIRGTERRRGVDVVSSSHAAAVDLNLVVEFGYSIPQIIEDVRKEVRKAIHEMCDMDARVINIEVTNIHSDGTDPARAAIVR